MSNKCIEEDVNRGMVNSGGLIEGAGMFELMRGDQMHVICDFLARYVRKLHSDLYIKNKLGKKAGLTFLDLIGRCIIRHQPHQE